MRVVVEMLSQILKGVSAVAAAAGLWEGDCDRPLYHEPGARLPRHLTLETHTPSHLLLFIYNIDILVMHLHQFAKHILRMPFAAYLENAHNIHL
jgi:hypothetical protein